MDHDDRQVLFVSEKAPRPASSQKEDAMAEIVTPTIPLHDLPPPRVLEELSSQIGSKASSAIGKINEHARVWEKSVPPNAVSDYVRDFWQRSVLFLDILRQRGNQHDDMVLHGVSSVLIYESELIMRGDELPRPVNYSLVRVIPPDGVEIDDRKRPVFVIDPRAGQGPGIGGLKHTSEIGEAFRAGHPVYFAGFTASPVEGQRIEDVARAFTIFIAKVAELHPNALGKPFVFGNCQAGWHAMIAACMRPDVVGPMVIAGTPLSYWAGVRGKNAMRYLGGWYGGSWADRMMSDMGNGTFDAAWLVANFDNLNPSNTFWTKQYNVWVNPEQEKNRYLDFEKWWGDFVVLRGEEMQWMVDNLFIGNKFSTGQIITSEGIRLDMREIKSPIVCFCSHGDNITPPQQALDWILDNYQTDDEIRQCGQRIFYNIDPKVGHLAIFVGTKVAEKNHAEFINNMELIDAMPPGLYEILITEKPGTEGSKNGGAVDFDFSIEERGLDDIRALGCNSLEDEREFAAAARVSDHNNALYQAFLQPWIKMTSAPQIARAVIELNPLRLGYSLLSDRNLAMRAVAPLANQVRADRTPLSADNPFIAMQQQFSETMVHGLNIFRDLRDEMVEGTFHAIYGAPLVQAACGISYNDSPPRPRPGLLPSLVAAAEKEKLRLKGRIAEGNVFDAAARVLVYVGRAQHRIDEGIFNALRKLLLAYPEISEAEFKAALREQWAILEVDERAAIEALPRLLPRDAGARRDFSDLVQKTLPAVGKLNVEAQRRFSKVLQLLSAETALGHEVAAE
jgi:pimeloyl-ACP methyl ester carboxylesterase